MAGYDTDFKAIAGNAKKSDAFKAMAGGDDPDTDDTGGGDSEDVALGEAFAAQQGNDEAGFKAAMAAAMRACYASESAASVKK